MKKTLYDNLRIPRNASAELVELAYQVRKKKLEAATDPESQDELKLLRQTIEILSDAEQRLNYDQSLAPETYSHDSAADEPNEVAEEGKPSAKLKWLALATLAVASFLAYQYFIQADKKAAAAVREASIKKGSANLPLNGADRVTPGQGAAQASELKSALAGSWKWKSDKINFRSDDRGIYYRDNAVCYEFSYGLRGDVLTETADSPHSCGIGLAASFRISIDENHLRKENIGSGYESQWEKFAESP